MFETQVWAGNNTWHRVTRFTGIDAYAHAHNLMNARVHMGQRVRIVELCNDGVDVRRIVTAHDPQNDLGIFLVQQQFPGMQPWLTTQQGMSAYHMAIRAEAISRDGTPCNTRILHAPSRTVLVQFSGDREVLPLTIARLLVSAMQNQLPNHPTLPREGDAVSSRTTTTYADGTERTEIWRCPDHSRRTVMKVAAVPMRQPRRIRLKPKSKST